MTSTATRPRMRVLLDQECRTSDGVLLRTDVYLPAEDSSPVILVHTPYGRNMALLLRMAQWMTRAGLGVVLQDSRGRYQSEGTFDLMKEEADCAETVGWISRQPWSNRKIALLGMSISSYANFRVAGGLLPEGVELSAMASLMGASGYRPSFFSQGVLILHWALPWMTLIHSERGRTAWRQQPWEEVFRHLPLLDLAEMLELDSEMWRAVLLGGYNAAFWKDLDAFHCLPEIETPTLHISGWYDFMLPQTVASYREMARHGKRQQLVIGPWDHRSLFRSFGDKAEQAAGNVNLMQVLEDFFTRWMRDEVPDEASSTVDLYVVHRDRWIVADGLRPSVGESLDFYLSSEKDARTLNGDGSLLEEPPAALGQQTFLYDPRDPAPTQGGAVWPFEAAGLEPGPADQSDVEQREDVLVYTSEILEDDLLVVGPVEVELWAASSAADTDFTAKLVDVGEDEVPRIVQDGIIRCRYAEDPDSEHLIKANQPTRFRVDLQVCGYCFREGHQIRLEISSSNFPKYDRNLNSSSPLYRHSNIVAANQTVFHGGAFASRLRLSVLDSKHLDTLGRS